MNSVRKHIDAETGSLHSFFKYTPGGNSLTY
jgi:hypothetical protein